MDLRPEGYSSPGTRPANTDPGACGGETRGGIPEPGLTRAPVPRVCPRVVVDSREPGGARAPPPNQLGASGRRPPDDPRPVPRTPGGSPPGSGLIGALASTRHGGPSAGFREIQGDGSAGARAKRASRHPGRLQAVVVQPPREHLAMARPAVPRLQCENRAAQPIADRSPPTTPAPRSVLKAAHSTHLGTRLLPSPPPGKWLAPACQATRAVRRRRSCLDPAAARRE